MPAPLILAELSPNPGSELSITRTTTVGRVSGDLVLDDPEASRTHAEITLEADGPAVRDLGSRNGTFVNDRRIGGPARLRQGDTLRIGRTSWRVASGTQAEPAASAVPVTEAERPRRAQPSAARLGAATTVAFAVVAADAIALAIYFIAR